MARSQLEYPKWHKDLLIYEGIKTGFIIEGNVHDLQDWIYPEENVCEPITMDEYLYRFLEGEGYDIIVFYNQVDGFSNIFQDRMRSDFFKIAKADPKSCKSFEAASTAMRTALQSTERPVAVIFDLANTAITPSGASELEMECMTRLFIATEGQHQAMSSQTGSFLNNLLFFITEKVNDIPAWFYINNPFIKGVTVTKPDKELRQSYIERNMQVFHDISSLAPEENDKVLRQLANLTEGFSNVELYGLMSLCEKRQISARKAREAVNLFKYGETESHWDKLDPEMIRNAGEILSRRVKGQPRAIAKATDIISRACAGLSGIQGSAAGKPKGILFFAGPTGTGKTELAKAITELIFGDEKFMIRFDMSEYQQAHADQKLLGAPPGYVGYESGGQLTNAVKEKPFSVLLFDEIDKADPSILDKFLQILEDGRMTDSSGETVYFSETLIIFTSNLGMFDTDPVTGARYQNVTMDMSYEEMEERILGSIRNFFNLKIGRPELLNRIGNNFVVFDFIRDEVVDLILQGQIDKIRGNLHAEHGITLTLSDVYYQTLRKKAGGNLINGGRGIGNVVESYLVNPLSRVLVMQSPAEGDTIQINGMEEDGTLDVTISPAGAAKK